MTEAIAKEKPLERPVSVKTELLPKWVAIIYLTAKEARMSDDLLEDRPVPIQRAPIWRSIGLKPRINPETQQWEGDSLQLRPGANLGILSWQLEEIQENAICKSLFTDGTFKTVYPIPENAQNENYFRYSAFSIENALALVKTTTHESWLDEWGQEERREEVLRAISEQKTKIVKMRERNKAA